MHSPVRCFLAVMVIVIASGPAIAAFHVSDLIYIPAVADTAGAEGSQWRTDLYITNVDTVPIDVLLVYLPSGSTVNNSGFFDDRSLWLGGREEEGVGFVDESLADIPPNGTVVIEDVVRYWEEQLGLIGLGAMVIFAHEAGSLDDEGGRVFRNAVAHARVYNDTTIFQEDPENEGEFIEVPASYGQIVPGVPWYNLADPAAVSDQGNFSFQILTGGVQNDTFRYNLGILNASDKQTAITVVIQPFQANGDPYLDENEDEIVRVLSLAPLVHTQINEVLSSLGIGEADQAMIKVSFFSWSSAAADPIPAMTCYGSMVDNRSNDPTTILPSFGFPYNVECMFPPQEDGEAKGFDAPCATGDGGRSVRRPVRVPAKQIPPN